MTKLYNNQIIINNQITITKRIGKLVIGNWNLSRMKLLYKNCIGIPTFLSGFGVWDLVIGIPERSEEYLATF